MEQQQPSLADARNQQAGRNEVCFSVESRQWAGSISGIRTNEAHAINDRLLTIFGQRIVSVELILMSCEQHLPST
jgi:hypothetical protein